MIAGRGSSTCKDPEAGVCLRNGEEFGWLEWSKLEGEY